MSYAHNCTHFTGTKRFHKVHRKKKVKKRNGPHQNKYAKVKEAAK